jgi:transcriptional regulator with XRE-family HTH domain
MGNLRSKPRPPSGKRLQSLRLRLGLTMRDVEEASRRLAQTKHNKKMILFPGRLSVIESGEAAPSIFRVYALAKIYHCAIQEIFALYGLR